ncbi:DUF4214 domain-containing protein [Novosphingobium olei]|uniref:DUF4214 domain-containing protein n=1 Tax=Novosphingobium olei TaxID=2728851 RepID=A0A7Y0BKV0_9SPHN|nr:DUF4214 domain-containing protein [Novosphingobium olei]NML92239.1 DUF4214 domain-containing protein [Novosphingobium olei]
MSGLNADIFEDTEADIDLRRYPVNQTGPLLDLVLFDRFLDYAYAVLLKREPDPEGRSHYRDLARRGVARPAIVRGLLRSREHRASSVEERALTHAEFVNRAYQDILGRWPDEDGLATYQRIAARFNGRRKVLANLLASDEGLRKSGGRLARIEGLKAYARAGWPLRLPGLGTWFAARRRRRQRIDRIALNQQLLAREIAALREEVEAASLGGAEPFGFLTEAPDPGSAQGRAALVFGNALIRARREG